MADYTILEQSYEANTAKVVIEYDVATNHPGNNNAGVAWTAVVSELRAAANQAGITNNPRRTADATYIGNLDSGNLMEIVATFEYDANLSDAAKATALDNDVAVRISQETAEFANKYKYFGTVRSV